MSHLRRITYDPQFTNLNTRITVRMFGGVSGVLCRQLVKFHKGRRLAELLLRLNLNWGDPGVVEIQLHLRNLAKANLFR